jgi:tetratricopeptide (TPR) repeat protein
VYGEEALRTSRELGDAITVARSLEVLAIASAQAGDYAEAARLFEQSITAGREAGERSSTVAMSIANLGELALRHGEYERALTLIEEAIGITRELGRDDLSAWTLHLLALCLFRLGREESSRAAALESLAFAQSVGHVQTLAMELVFVAALGVQNGAIEVGARLLGAAETLKERFTMSFTGVEAELHRETVTTLRHTLGDTKYENALAQGRAIPLNEAIQQASETLSGTRGTVPPRRG